MTRPDADDLPHTAWVCEECQAVNSTLDADCQYCDGPAFTEVEFMGEIERFPVEKENKHAAT
jgi:hypothetical protein